MDIKFRISNAKSNDHNLSTVERRHSPSAIYDVSVTDIQIVLLLLDIIHRKAFSDVLSTRSLLHALDNQRRNLSMLASPKRMKSLIFSSAVTLITPSSRPQRIELACLLAKDWMFLQPAFGMSSESPQSNPTPPPPQQQQQQSAAMPAMPTNLPVPLPAYSLPPPAVDQSATTTGMKMIVHQHAPPSGSTACASEVEKLPTVEKKRPMQFVEMPQSTDGDMQQETYADSMELVRISTVLMLISITSRNREQRRRKESLEELNSCMIQRIAVS